MNLCSTGASLIMIWENVQDWPPLLQLPLHINKLHLLTFITAETIFSEGLIEKLLTLPQLLFVVILFCKSLWKKCLKITICTCFLYWKMFNNSWNGKTETKTLFCRQRACALFQYDTDCVSVFICHVSEKCCVSVNPSAVGKSCSISRFQWERGRLPC